MNVQTIASFALGIALGYYVVAHFRKTGAPV